MLESRLSDLEQKLGVQFHNPLLLKQALIHKSALMEMPNLDVKESYERLEFLGDAVLSLISAKALYSEMAYADEGKLSQLRALYVCETHLLKAAQTLDLEPWIVVAKSVRGSGMLKSESILADIVEALIGAIYLDQGLDIAEQFIFRILGPPPLQLGPVIKDAKSILQEKLQAICAIAPQYQLLHSTGPAHAPVFLVEVHLASKAIATGQGSNKKEASQEAAKLALQVLEGLSPGQIKQKFGL